MARKRKTESGTEMAAVAESSTVAPNGVGKTKAPRNVTYFVIGERRDGSGQVVLAQTKSKRGAGKWLEQNRRLAESLCSPVTVFRGKSMEGI